MSNRFHNKFHRHNHHSTATDPSIYPDSAYDPIASREAPFQGEFYSEGDIVTTQNITADGSITALNGIINTALYVGGDLTVEGDSALFNTNVSFTSSIEVNCPDTIEDYIFRINSNSQSIFYVRGNNFSLDPYFVGIGTNDPSHMLTVDGDIKSGGIIYDGTHNSEEWNSVYTTVCSTSTDWDSAYQYIEETVKPTLTSVGDILASVSQLGDFVPTITVNKSASSALIQKDLTVAEKLSAGGNVVFNQNLSVSGVVSISNNLDANSQFSFSKFKTLSASLLNSSNQIITFPTQLGNDIVVVTADTFTNENAQVSAFANCTEGSFYILTNGMPTTNLEILSNEKIRLRGANTISLNLSYGDSCCVRGRENNIVSVW